VCFQIKCSYHVFEFGFCSDMSIILCYKCMDYTNVRNALQEGRYCRPTGNDVWKNTCIPITVESFVKQGTFILLLKPYFEFFKSQILSRIGILKFLSFGRVPVDIRSWETTWSKALLINGHSLSWPRNFLPFMGSEYIVVFTRTSHRIICESVEPNPHPHTLFLEDSFQYYPPISAQLCKVVPGFQISSLKCCRHFSFPLRVLLVTAIPVSPSPIWSPT
jgi:hypothetical protein